MMVRRAELQGPARVSGKASLDRMVKRRVCMAGIRIPAGESAPRPTSAHPLHLSALGMIGAWKTWTSGYTSRIARGPPFDGCVFSSYYPKQSRITYPNALPNLGRASALPAYRPINLSATVSSVRITDDDIRRYQEIWQKEFGEEITADEARQTIARLDAFYLFLARRPDHSEPPRSEEETHQ